MSGPPLHWRECEECEGGYVEVRVGERMCAGQGGPYEPVIKHKRCQVCENGYVAVEWWEEGYENAIEEKP